MRHTNGVVVAIAAFAVALAGTVLGLAAWAGSAGSAGATTAHSAATGSTVSIASGPRPVILDCGATPRVRPSGYVLACADDAIGLQHLHWTSWTARLASGYGTLYENDCAPSCAAGHFRSYRALAVLWGSTRVTGHPGDCRYTKLTLFFHGRQRPPVYHSVKGRVVATHPLTQTLDT